MFCKNCGQKIKDGAAFCIYCGTKVMLPSSEMQTSAGVPQEVQPTQPHQSVQPQLYNNPVSHKRFSWMPVIIGAICVLVVAGGAFLVIRLHQDANDEIETTDYSDESEVEDSFSDTVGQEIEPVSEDTDRGTAEQEQVENTVEEMHEDEIHTYELIVADVTWTEAYQSCLDRGGYLVRINSEDEYQAILSQVWAEDKGNIKFWLGGARDESSNTYHWIYEDTDYEGEALNNNEKYVAYWLDKEPSFVDETTGETETFMNMFYISSQERWVWNDTVNDILGVLPNYAGTIGYICEYEN